MSKQEIDILKESLLGEIGAVREAKASLENRVKSSDEVVREIATNESDRKTLTEKRATFQGNIKPSTEAAAKKEIAEVDRTLAVLQEKHVDLEFLQTEIDKNIPEARKELILAEGRLNGLTLSKVRSLRGAYVDQVHEHAAAILRVWQEWQGFVNEAQHELGVSLYEYDRDLHKLDPGLPDFVEFMKSLHPQYVSA